MDTFTDRAHNILNEYIQSIRATINKKKDTNLLFLNNHGNPIFDREFLSDKNYAKISGIKKNVTPHTF